VSEVATEFEGIELLLRDKSQAPGDGVRVVATPTLLLPDGRRLTGTPSVERLRGVLSELLGKDAPVPNKVWYLQHNRLFRGVPLEEIEKYAHLFHEQDFKPKEIVFSEGDLGDAIYLLKTGHVRLYRLTEDGKELTLAILGPGDVFGELALFKEVRRQTFAEALEDAHICAASIEDFTRLMSHKPQLTMMVAGEIARRRSEMETRIAGLAYGSVRTKLIMALRHLAREHGEPRADGKVRIGIRLSHQELAQLIGVSRETCTIELGKLQKNGVVFFDDDRYIVVDPERLEPGIFDRVVQTMLGT
jgi:CRP/FNR family cyclic AMP-dependent transcriptional regulator